MERNTITALLAIAAGGVGVAAWSATRGRGGSSPAPPPPPRRPYTPAAPQAPSAWIPPSYGPTPVSETQAAAPTPQAAAPAPTGYPSSAKRLNFETAVQKVLLAEGGYVDHPADKGGATNMGITIGTLSSWRGRPATKTDVRNLTVGEAKAIYKARYWDKVRASELPAALAYMTFDTAVLSGPGRAARTLQRAVGAKVDGAIGPDTVDAAQRVDVQRAVHNFYGTRMSFLQALDNWGVFGRGWSARMDRLRASALALL
jgi:hypothetical protein